MKTTLWVTLACLGGLMSASAGGLYIYDFDRQGTLSWTNSPEYTAVQVERTATLKNPNWVVVTNVSPVQFANTVQVEMSSARNGFFRLRGTITNGVVPSALNAVGYAHLTLKPGYNLVGNPFTKGSNTLDEIFPPDCGLPEDTFVVTWDPMLGGAGGPDRTAFFYPGYGWEGPRISLPPGRGFMLYINPGTTTNTECTVKMIGEIRQGAVCYSIYGGCRYNLLSSPIPMEGKLTTDLGLVPQIDDMALLWDSSATPPGPNKTYFYIGADVGMVWNPNVGAGVWTDLSQIVEPQLRIGEAFLLFRSIRSEPCAWCRTFTIE